MNRRKRKTGKPSTKEGPKQSEAEPADNRMEGVLKVALVVLLLSRFFVPAENTAEGGTLLWVFLTFGIMTLWAWDGMKAGSVGFSLTRFDAAFLAIVFAHLISGLAVVLTEGQKRAALNMVWEWLGLGVTLFLLRQYVTDSGFYRQLLLAIVSLVVALSCLGIYQHFVWYPRETEKYHTLRNELDELEARRKTLRNSTMENRIREIQTDLAAQRIPLEGPPRKRFEDRLVSSSEPFGKFALANTFAGLLAVGLLLVLGAFVSESWKNKSLVELVELVSIVLVLLLIGYCLLLTESRTAWVGTFCGAAFIVWMTFRTKFLSEKFSKIAGIGAIAFVGIGVLVLGSVLTSGLDAKAMSEAPRSLRFRFQYWQGTWGVIGESPILGTGPGNFRQHYLKHKLPESSEEILDPHNFLFDLWANAGILAALGIFAAIFFAIRSVMQSFKRFDYEKEQAPKKSGEVPPSPLVLIGLILSLLVLLWESDWGNNIEIGVNLGVCAIAVVTFLFLSRFPRNLFSNPAILSGCCVAMLVHLLGAGGIEMPTVVIVLLMFSVAITRNHHGEKDFHFEFRSAKRIATVPVVGLLLTLGCFFTGFYPTFHAKSLMSLATSATLNGDFKAAETYFRKATEVDPLSPDPWVDLSTLLYRQSLLGDSQNKKFEEAVKLQKRAIYRNPHSWQGYRMLGVWFAGRYRNSGKKESLETAIENFEKAVVRYPTNSQLRAEFAIFLSETKQNDEARKLAREALVLDGINRKEGHTDKYLDKYFSDDQLTKLTKIAEE